MKNFGGRWQVSVNWGNISNLVLERNIIAYLKTNKSEKCFWCLMPDLLSLRQILRQIHEYMKHKYTNIEANTQKLRLFATSSRQILHYYFPLNLKKNSGKYFNFFKYLLSLKLFADIW